MQRALTLTALDSEDSVAIVTYASGTEVRLAPTPVSEQQIIADVINGLDAAGSTAGASGDRVPTCYGGRQGSSCME